jgi:predicted O-methyltransferase YrrM
MDTLAAVIRESGRVPGWTRGDEAVALAEAAYHAPENAVIVEIGVFLGGGSILMAGARKLRGSGKVHCVDPFDASGDPVSTPHYEAILMAFGAGAPLDLFRDNMAYVGLTDWVEAHRGLAPAIARSWSTEIDLLVLDGDQSPKGALAAYKAWSPWLKSGGVIALHNSAPREYQPEHDGHYRVAKRHIQEPGYVEKRVRGSTTFARKADASKPARRSG